MGGFHTHARSSGHSEVATGPPAPPRERENPLPTSRRPVRPRRRAAPPCVHRNLHTHKKVYMEGLILFSAGILLACLNEDLPKWVKTAIWVMFVVIGLLLGAAKYFRLPA